MKAQHFMVAAHSKVGIGQGNGIGRPDKALAAAFDGKQDKKF